jgi:hypothetical protein
VHTTASGSHPFAPTVDIVPPRSVPDGEVYAPSLSVWPFGHTDHGHGFHLALLIDEADELGNMLISAAREAREMFPNS